MQPITSNVYLFSKNSWQKIGTINPNQIIKENIPNIYTLQQTSKKILELIQNDSIKNLQIGKKFFVLNPSDDKDKLEIILLHIMRFRRCTVYIFEQINHKTNLKRILAYGNDEIKHHAICFGTSLDLVDGKTIEKSLCNEVKRNFGTHIFFI
ncbi:Hypothetical protein KVN_LOCUS23 [uncultured virus]|nr:Hypothetical protein KVN_LOCUS23 [uncultured virus]